MKEILDRNSATIGISLESVQYLDINPAFHLELQQNRFKTVDCKLLNIILEDLRRQYIMAKVKDDDIIFK